MKPENLREVIENKMKYIDFMSQHNEFVVVYSPDFRLWFNQARAKMWMGELNQINNELRANLICFTRDYAKTN